jgi:hypothetical protein
MSEMIKTFLVSAALLGSLTAAFAGTPAATKPRVAAATYGTPLTSAELVRLYEGRTWLWSAGAGYFSPKKRAFSAWSAENGKLSYGEGIWFASDNGKLCFRAKWTGKSGTAPATTCFSHRTKGGAIYQKREPSGDWYLFKHARTRSSDEYAKFTSGDLVAGRLAKVKARLGAKS